jgi:hypothetical protein
MAAARDLVVGTIKEEFVMDEQQIERLLYVRLVIYTVGLMSME